MQQPTEKTESVASTVMSCFNNDVIKEVLKANFTNSKTKITEEAIELMTDLANTLVMESALRAAKQCSTENKTLVTLEHLESALPQIMLDFP